MAKTITEISSFPLAGQDKGVVSIAKITEPYGEGSDPVVSIGITLDGKQENPDFKAHIPLANLDELIQALQKIQ